MSTTKKTNSTEKEVKETKTEAKVDLNIELEKEKSEKEELKQQLELMKQQMEQNQQMMMQLQQSMLVQQPKPTNGMVDMNEKISIVSYAWGRLSLKDAHGSTIVRFKDSYEVEIISYNELRQIMTTDNKNKFFKTGLVAFVGESEKFYESELISKPFVLSKENLIEIYKLPYDQCINKLNQLISNDERVKQCILWQSVRLLAKQEINDMNAYSLIPSVLMSYFGCRNVESAKGQVNLAKDVGYIH